MRDIVEALRTLEENGEPLFRQRGAFVLLADVLEDADDTSVAALAYAIDWDTTPGEVRAAAALARVVRDEMFTHHATAETWTPGWRNTASRNTVNRALQASRLLLPGLDELGRAELDLHAYAGLFIKAAVAVFAEGRTVRRCAYRRCRHWMAHSQELGIYCSSKCRDRERTLRFREKPQDQPESNTA